LNRICTISYDDIVRLMDIKNREAFVIGVALGDGSLSNPNSKAVRLRITCDNKYPVIMEEIMHALQTLFPKNIVSLVARKDNCSDISVYSNKLHDLLPWKADCGSKHHQQAHVPMWIFEQKEYSIACLRGLIISDGSIYKDRGYLMVNVCSNIEPLAKDILKLGTNVGFTGRLTSTNQPSGKQKNTIRFAKNTRELLRALNLKEKS